MNNISLNVHKVTRIGQNTQIEIRDDGSRYAVKRLFFFTADGDRMDITLFGNEVAINLHDTDLTGDDLK